MALSGSLSRTLPNISTASSYLPMWSSMSALNVRTSAAALPSSDAARSSYAAAASSYLPIVRAVCASFRRTLWLAGSSLDASASEAVASSNLSRAYSELPFISCRSAPSPFRSRALS